MNDIRAYILFFIIVVISLLFVYYEDYLTLGVCSKCRGKGEVADVFAISGIVIETCNSCKGSGYKHTHKKG